MRGLIAFVTIALTALAWAPGPSAAEEVAIEYLGLDLTANLETAGKSLRNENVVLLVHDTLAHARVELMAALQDGLRDVGVSSLAITLGLGLNHRRGMFDCSLEQDHRHEDAVDEIAAWVAWLKEKGATSITVAGHGRGANQVALYAINRLDKPVKRIVLIAPMMQTEDRMDADYRRRFGKPLRPELAKAEELVANEQGNQLVNVPGFLNCPHPQVTAGAFADYYGANEKFKTTNLLAGVKLPILIAVGDGDPNLRDIQAAEAENPKSIAVAVIPGADREFRDLAADELARKIKEFSAHRTQG